MGTGCQRASTLFVTVLLLPVALRAGINTWTSLGPDGGAAQTLAVDPQDPNTGYASTEAGLFKITDGAASWTAINSPPLNGGGITSLVVDPGHYGTLYVASGVGDPGRDALFKSTDAGATWKVLKSGSLFGPSGAVAIDPQNPSRPPNRYYKIFVSKTPEMW